MASLKLTVHTDGLDAVMERMTRAATEAEHIVAIHVRKDTSPFVPMLTGSLDKRTKVYSNRVIYQGPYARYLYYGKLMVDPETGSAWAKKGASKVETDKNLVFSKEHHSRAQSHWFEASKAQNLDEWIRVARKKVKHGL